MLTTVNMALASVASLAAAPALVLPVPLKAHLALLATSNTGHGHAAAGGKWWWLQCCFCMGSGAVRHLGLAPHRPIKHQAQMAQLGASYLAMAVQVKPIVG